MTGDYDGDRVGRASTGNGTNGSGPADCAGNVGIRPHRTTGNGKELLPHATLKRGGLNVQRQVAAGGFAFDAGKHRAKPGLKAIRVTANLCERVFVLQCGFEARNGIAETHHTNSARSSSNEQASQRSSDGCVLDAHAGAATLVGRRSHAKQCGSVFVKAAARTVTGVVKGEGDIGFFFQSGLDGPQTARSGILARGDARDALKSAEQTKRAETGSGAEIGKRNLLVETGFDETAELLNARGERIASMAARMAAATGAEASALGGVGTREKNSQAAVWTARRTRGAAVNPRGTDRINKSAIPSWVVGQDGTPAARRTRAIMLRIAVTLRSSIHVLHAPRLGEGEVYFYPVLALKLNWRQGREEHLAFTSIRTRR